MIDPKNLRLPQYDDASDYTTNSPSYYDYLARISELINELAKKVCFYDEELAKRFKEWDDLIQKFPENVENLLIEWMKDGTLDDIINQNIFNDLNNDIKALDKKTGDELKLLANNLQLLKNDYNSFIDHFIINVGYLKGTDTERIQQALDLCHSMGGGTIYLPSGTYILTNELVIYSNTTFWCVEGVKLVRQHNGYMIMNGKRGSNYTKYNGNGNIRFINGIWDGNAMDSSITTGSNIAIAHAENVLFDNVTIQNANSHHIELNSSKNVTIRNCKILGQLASMQFVEGIQLDLATENGFGAFGAYDSTSCMNVHIHDCLFGASKELPSLSRGVGTHAVRIGMYMENVTIENNKFEKLRDFAIQLLCYRDCTIKNNVFDSCTGGVIIYSSNPENENHVKDIYNEITTKVQPCTNVFIENNTFKTMGTKQVLYSFGREKSRNDNIYFVNNKIFDCLSPSGIIIAVHTDYVTADNNTIKNTGVFPIYLRNDTFISVQKNNIELSTHIGIRLEEKIRYAKIIGNTILKVGGNSINVFNDSYSVIISENICIGSNGKNEEHSAIYSHTSCGKILVINNIIRPLTGYKYVNAVYITNTNTNCVIDGNITDLGSGDAVLATTSTIGTNY